MTQLSLIAENIIFYGRRVKILLIPGCLKQWEKHNEIVREFSVTEAQPCPSETRNNHVTAAPPSFTVVCILESHTLNPLFAWTSEIQHPHT